MEVSEAQTRHYYSSLAADSAFMTRFMRIGFPFSLVPPRVVVNSLNDVGTGRAVKKKKCENVPGHRFSW
jgi:hypothetical protein